MGPISYTKCLMGTGYQCGVDTPKCMRTEPAIGRCYDFGGRCSSAYAAGLRWLGLELFLVTLLIAQLYAADTRRPALTYTKSFGGRGEDIASAIAVDAAGNLYIAGYTVSPNFPVVNAFQSKPGSTSYTDAFVAKWSADGTQVFYSSYLGGAGVDIATGIAVDKNGGAYVTGYTESPDFPVTQGAFQRTLRGYRSAFLTKLGPGGELIYSTLLGGSGIDAAAAIAVDGSGNAYITGYAGSSDFPTRNAIQSRIRQNCSSPPGSSAAAPLGSEFSTGDAFVSEINPGGSDLVYSTYLGGPCADQGLGITLDSQGAAYIAGVTNSVDFPTTSGAVQTNFTSARNSGFLSKLAPFGTSLVYSTFLGSVQNDLATAVTVDSSGNAYVTGSSSGLTQPLLPPGSCVQILTANISGFPMVSGVAAFITKLDPSGASRLYEKYLGGCNPGGASIAADSSGRVWVAGSSGSAVAFPGAIYGFPGGTGFPEVHPFQGLGLGRGFLSQISTDGQTVLFSSLLDWAVGMALDPAGHVYVAGATRNTTIPKQTMSGSAPLTGMVVRVETAVPSAVTIESPQSMATTPHHPSNSLYPSVLAPGAMVTISRNGPGSAQHPIPGRRIDPRARRGTSVTFNGVAAPLISVQPDTVVSMVPFSLGDADTVEVQVTSGGRRSNAIRAPLLPSAVEILSVVNQDGSANTSSHPANPGTAVTVYAAGMGQTDPPSVDGSVNAAGDSRVLQNAMALNLNGWLVPAILYSGPAPGQIAGIMQINFKVPDLATGEYHLLLSAGVDQDAAILNVAR